MTQALVKIPGTIRLELPYPPSVNHYWRMAKGVVYVSAEGLRFRKVVVAVCKAAGIQPITGKLDLHFEVWPPDRIRRDLDNVQKALLDALKHGGCCGDDSQIKHIDATMHDYTQARAGRTVATLKRMDGPQCIQEELFDE